MPASYKKARPHPRYKEFTLNDAAKNGQIIKIKCGMCSKTLHFLASDLAKVYGENHPANDPPFPCSTCKTDEFFTVRPHTPDVADYGHLIIRRPGQVKKIQMWENVKLGDDVVEK